MPCRVGELHGALVITDRGPATITNIDPSLALVSTLFSTNQIIYYIRINYNIFSSHNILSPLSIL